MVSGSSPVIAFCNIGLVTEEVIEAVFLGQGRFDISIGGDDVGAPVDPKQTSGSVVAHRRNRFIIVDIADYVRNICFRLPRKVCSTDLSLISIGKPSLQNIN
jgi:hypothetical protein